MTTFAPLGWSPLGWGYEGEQEVVEPAASFTSAGGYGTTWARKTLSRQRREQEAALKRAKERVIRIIELEVPALPALPEIIREEIRQETPEMPPGIEEELYRRLVKRMRAALIRRLEEEDEAEAEAFLLAA